MTKRTQLLVYRQRFGVESDLFPVQCLCLSVMEFIYYSALYVWFHQMNHRTSLVMDFLDGRFLF